MWDLKVKNTKKTFIFILKLLYIDANNLDITLTLGKVILFKFIIFQ